MASNRQLRDRRYAMTALGKVQVVTGTAQIEVISPYHVDFVKGAKALGGEWNTETRAWVFSPARRAAVLALVGKVYGGLKASQGKKACGGHRFLRIAGGIRCMYCGLFKERSL